MKQSSNKADETQLESKTALSKHKASIEKVIVNYSTKTWTLIMSGNFGLTVAKQEELTKCFALLFPHVLRFDFIVNQKRQQSFSELYFTDADYDKLCEHIALKLPVAGALLKNSSYQAANEMITITVNNNTGIDLFRNKIFATIKEYFTIFFGKEIPVELVVNPLSEVQVNLTRELELHLSKICQPNYNLGKPNKKVVKEKSTENSSLILGKNIFSEVVSINDINEEEKGVTLWGYIFNLEEKVFKTARKLITFDLTDKTNSISVKIFSPEKGEFFPEKLTNNACVKINGTVKYDNYSNELTLFPLHIKLAPEKHLDDCAVDKRVELHLHTKFSSMDGVSSPEQYIAQAAKWGHPAIAITDHGGIQAFPEAYELGEKHKIKIIYGVEAYLADDETDDPDYLKSSSYHVILLVKNYIGLKNLYKLISLSHLEYFFRRPKIPKSILTAYREGLLVGSACEAGELISHYLKGASHERLVQIANYYDFLEIQPMGNNQFLIRNGTVTEQELQQVNIFIVQLSKEIKKPAVATGDVHFLNQEDAIYRQILMHSKGYEDADLQPPLYFRTTEQMLAEFSYLGKETAHKVVVDNPRKIADLVEHIKPIPDDFYPPKIEGAEEQIMQMTHARARELYGDKLPEIVSKRISKELDSIINNGFAVLYLISHKLVKKSNQDGYLVGSRGSVGSSFVATLTGITEVNPLPPHYRCPACKFSQFIEDGSIGCGADLPHKSCPICGKALTKDGHDIPFEVFLGFKGDKVPDIDLNFSGEYQGTIMKYTEELFGKSYVYRAGTITTVAERTAYGFVKKFLEENNKKVRNAEINRLVLGCTGVKRTTGQHPGGLMIVPKDKDIYDFTPIQYPADDTGASTITTHFDYHAISSRLVKLDILGHDDPTMIKMLEDLTGISAKSIPLDEPETISLFSGLAALKVTSEEIRSSVGTYGIPEFGTRFVRQMLEDTKPKTFSELVRISGFSHGTDVWLNNAQNLIKEGVAKLSEAISTRDDIMVFLIYQGMDPVLAFTIMENVRKGKGVSSEQEEAMLKADVPQWYIDSCKKIKYMFPKAHAVAYVIMAFRIAYFKVYYPEAFYASFFTVRADEFDGQIICLGAEVVLKKIIELESKGNEATAKEKNLLTILEVALEMYRRGIKMRKVSLWESHNEKFIVTSEGILPPLAGLQGVGKTAATNIMQARLDKLFNSVDDLRERSRISKTVIEALQEHGCLNGLPVTSQLELF
jgi:DNA polymerase-3 subunit alpha (Gram-positive type)